MARSSGAVLRKTLWQRRRAILWWSIGMVALAAATIGFYPSVRNDAESFEDLVNSMPEGLLSVFGIDDAASLVTPSGFINSRLYSGIGPAILAVFGISLGTAAVAGEEERGTLNLLLAQPLSRTRLVIEKFAAAAVAIVIVCVAIFVTLVVLNPVVDLDLPIGNMVAANFGLALLALVFAAIALAIGAGTGNRGATIGVTAALTVLAFFVNGLAPLVSSLAWAQNLSPFHWLQGPDRLGEGFSLGYSSLMIAVVAALVAVAVWTFNRRDIAS